MNNKKLDQALDWLLKEVSRQKFAEIGIRLIVHDGELKRIQKEIIEKEQ